MCVLTITVLFVFHNSCMVNRIKRYAMAKKNLHLPAPPKFERQKIFCVDDLRLYF